MRKNTVEHFGWGMDLKVMAIKATRVMLRIMDYREM